MDKVEKDVELGVEKLSKKRENLDNVCDKSEDTRDVVADMKGGKFPFTKHFAHLGSNVDVVLDDTVDEENRINKSEKSMGYLEIHMGGKRSSFNHKN